MSLQLAVACGVLNERGELLLSLRRDLRCWHLPGGYPDIYETMAVAAARQVAEQTGIRAEIQRAAGLYYWPGFNRMTVLFSGSVVGGALPRTDKSVDHRFFWPDDLPDMPGAILAHDALAGTRHLPRTLETLPAERRKIWRALRWRRLKERLRGRPEDVRPEPEVCAVGVVLEEGTRRVLTLSRKRTEVLPRVVCSGERSPWDELAARVKAETGVEAVWRWVGLWESVEQGRLEFVFAATAPEWTELFGRAQWSTARNAALPARETVYVSQVRPTFALDPVWMVGDEALSRAGDTLLWSKETDG